MVLGDTRRVPGKRHCSKPPVSLSLLGFGYSGRALVRSGCGAETPPWGGPPGCQQALREQGTQGLLLEDGTRVSGPHTWQRATLRPPVHLSRMEGCSSSLGDSATSTGSLDLCPGEHNQQ